MKQIVQIKSSQLVDLIHQKRMKEVQSELELKVRRRKQSLEARSNARDLSDMHGRLTAGNLVKHGIYGLDEEVMDLVR